MLGAVPLDLNLATEGLGDLLKLSDKVRELRRLDKL
jgi:hypothetical protein